MTAPELDRPRVKRKPEKLIGQYVTDDELYAWLGVPADKMRPFVAMCDRDPTKGFPRKDPNFGDRRYLPAVDAWLKKYNRLTMDAPRRDRHDTPENRGRTRHRVEAPQGRQVAVPLAMPHGHSPTRV